MKPTFQHLPAGGAASRSRGLTMIELLISVTLGLLITVVIGQLFLGSRATFATTDDLSRMQENMRFAQQLLIRTVHMAGYKSKPNSVTSEVFATAPALAYTAGASATLSDTLTLRFQGSGSQTPAGCASVVPATCTGADSFVLDCLGVAVDSGVMAVNIFSIANGANGQPALFCNNGVNDVEIVPDVHNMQILFGEDTDADLTANNYVAAPGNMANVVSLRIALLFASPNSESKAATDNRTYDMMGDGVSVLGPFADRRLRRVLVTTINLRNRTP